MTVCRLAIVDGTEARETQRAYTALPAKGVPVPRPLPLVTCASQRGPRCGAIVPRAGTEDARRAFARGTQQEASDGDRRRDAAAAGRSDHRDSDPGDATTAEFPRGDLSHHRRHHRAVAARAALSLAPRAAR